VPIWGIAIDPVIAIAVSLITVGIWGGGASLPLLSFSRVVAP
jgi:hypothetical protein